MKNSIKVVEIESFGGPENMQLVDKPVPVPGPGEVRVRLAAIGVNLIDTYHRTGLYPVPLPSGLGVEGAGELQSLPRRNSYRLFDAKHRTQPIGIYTLDLAPANLDAGAYLVKVAV